MPNRTLLPGLALTTIHRPSAQGLFSKSVSESLRESFFDPLLSAETAMIGVVATRTRSRGLIRLRSADPADHPIIDPRYYSHAEDASVMLQAGAKFKSLIEI